MTPNFNFGILRICGSIKIGEIRHYLYPVVKDKLTSDVFYNEFQRRGLNFIFIDKDKSLKWNRENEVSRLINENMANIFVVNMTCSRSTELCSFLKRHLSFFHDARTLERSNYNTLSQAYGRIKHYQLGNDGQEIIWGAKIYIDRRVFEANCNTNRLLELKNLASRISGRMGPSSIVDIYENREKNNCIHFIQTRFNPTYRPRQRSRNENGKYEATMQGDTHVYSIQEIRRRQNTQLNEHDPYRLYPCYDDDDDEWWVVCYFLRRDTENRRYNHKTSNKSIHF
jgi:hypothetical protein